jgi:hypothetical protein
LATSRHQARDPHHNDRCGDECGGNTDEEIATRVSLFVAELTASSVWRNHFAGLAGWWGVSPLLMRRFGYGWRLIC